MLLPLKASPSMAIERALGCPAAAVQLLAQREVSSQRKACRLLQRLCSRSHRLSPYRRQAQLPSLPSPLTETPSPELRWEQQPL